MTKLLFLYFRNEEYFAPSARPSDDEDDVGEVDGEDDEEQLGKLLTGKEDFDSYRI